MTTIFYLSLPKNLTGGRTPKIFVHARVDDKIITTQFTHFFHAVINNVVPEDSEIRQYMTAEPLGRSRPRRTPPDSSADSFGLFGVFLIVPTARISPT